MKTATPKHDLVVLGHLLQAALQSKLSENVPVQVRCLDKDGTLLVMVQHPVDIVLNPQQTFGFLEQMILADHPTVGPKVQMHLRVAGIKQGYASHSFLIPSTKARETANFGEIPLGRPLPPPNPRIEIPPQPNPAATSEPHPWDQPIAGDTEATQEAAEGTPTNQPSNSKRGMLPLILAGAGLSVLIFSGTLYLLSRPCVVGGCQVMSEAEALQQKSTTTLQKPRSGKEILEAQQQLEDAIKLLESIPPWSSQHDKAQELIKSYNAQAERVSTMVGALKTAARAAYKSAGPPHPPFIWTEIQSMWQDAITQLQQLPTNSNLQPVAQEKIEDYQENLSQTNQRLFKERQAQAYLQSAKDAALIAEARQGVAQSLEHWQSVYSSWQWAMNRLKQIPKGTTAYQEAQQLTAQYLPKVASARDRKTQEQIAANAYNQGLRMAQRAKESQISNQLSQAVANWRNALSFVNQVSSNTYYYGKAQALASTYAVALKQTQAQLQVAMKLQQASRDLSQTCYNKTKACTYTIDNNTIKVRLNPAYLQTVRQTAFNAQTKGDTNAQTGVVNHILTLGEALEAISDNARIPLEVYNPDGTIIQAHNPNG
ncbi:MAG: hypothetical protein WBG73_12875 [Coleofasciculaceae cyanobacterium]